MVLNECYSVPTHIVNEIKNLDPDLRLAWDKVKREVRVERKVTRGKPLDASLLLNPVEQQMAKDGYCLWLSFTPSPEKWDMLLYTIKCLDMWKRGGAEAIDMQLNADEEREKEQGRRSWRSDVHHMSAEMFRHLNTPRTGWKPYEVKAD